MTTEATQVAAEIPAETAAPQEQPQPFLQALRADKKHYMSFAEVAKHVRRFAANKCTANLIVETLQALPAVFAAMAREPAGELQDLHFRAESTYDNYMLLHAVSNYELMPLGTLVTAALQLQLSDSGKVVRLARVHYNTTIKPSMFVEVTLKPNKITTAPKAAAIKPKREEPKPRKVKEVAPVRSDDEVLAQLHGEVFGGGLQARTLATDAQLRALVVKLLTGNSAPTEAGLVNRVSLSLMPSGKNLQRWTEMLKAIFEPQEQTSTMDYGNALHLGPEDISQPAADDIKLDSQLEQMARTVEHAIDIEERHSEEVGLYPAATVGVTLTDNPTAGEDGLVKEPTQTTGAVVTVLESGMQLELRNPVIDPERIKNLEFKTYETQVVEKGSKRFPSNLYGSEPGVKPLIGAAMLKELKKFDWKLSQHDWYYQSSQDPEVIRRGGTERQQLEKEAGTSSLHGQLFAAYLGALYQVGQEGGAAALQQLRLDWGLVQPESALS